MTPLYRRSVLECGMRSPRSRFEAAVVVVFLIAAAGLLVYFLLGFLGFH